jgi:hypothetical protein
MIPSDLQDLAHRVLWTFLQTMSGVMVASAMFSLDLNLLHAAVAAGVADALVLVKEASKTKLNSSN